MIIILTLPIVLVFSNPKIRKGIGFVVRSRGEREGQAPLEPLERASLERKVINHVGAFSPSLLMVETSDFRNMFKKPNTMNSGQNDTHIWSETCSHFAY
jgi:hypothetical protein